MGCATFDKPPWHFRYDHISQPFGRAFGFACLSDVRTRINQQDRMAVFGHGGRPIVSAEISSITLGIVAFA